MAYGVGNLESAPDCARQAGLPLEGFPDGQLPHRDFSSLACRQPLLDERLRPRGQENEEPPRIVDCLRRKPLEKRILPKAFSGRDGIGHRVARSRVQKTMIAPAGPAPDVTPFNEGDGEPAQREVPRHPAAGDASSDYQHLRFHQSKIQSSGPP